MSTQNECETTRERERIPHKPATAPLATPIAAALLVGALLAARSHREPSGARTDEPARPRLHVRVVGNDGRPVDNGVDADKDDWQLLFALPLPESWPDEPTVVVVPERASAHLSLFGGIHLHGKRVGNGEMVFDVEAGRTYRVGLTGPKQAWRPVTVAVGDEGTRIDVTLVATADSECGTLAITATAADGKMVQQDCVVHIEDAEEGAPLLRAELDFASEFTRSFVLPAGRYRVAIEGKPWRVWHGGVVAPSLYGRNEVEVEVRSGKTTPVRVPLVEGARIDLHLIGNVLAEDREALAPRPGQLRMVNMDGSVPTPQARVWLISERHWPVPISFTCPATGFGGGRVHVGPWFSLGTSQASEVLPVGRFRLEARMPGGRMASTDVVLVDGETTAVTLSFP